MSQQEAQSALTWDSYSDPVVYRQECAQIFAPNWLFVAHEALLPNATDSLAAVVGNDSVLIHRGQDGSLRGFHNVCMHRGSPLLPDGTHERTVLRCPYHGWTYGGSGELISAPRFNAASMPEKHERLSLQSVELASSFDMAFVRIGPLKGSSHQTALAPISGLLEGLNLQALELDTLLDFHFACNWKLYVENWLESYHLPWIHRALTRDIRINQYRVEIRDHAVCHKCLPETEDSVYAGEWMWLWPLTAWNSYDGGVSIERIIPDGPDSTRVEFTFLFEPGVSSDRREAARQMCRVVTLEDGGICERVHKSLKRGRFIPGPLSPVHESAITYFHDLVRAALGEV